MTTHRGKLIVLEGIDGSGKRTQVERLAAALAARGVALERLSFPNYDSFFGQMVAQFLNGAFGSLEQVDPHFSALLYAGDRLEARPVMEAALAAGRTLLADRYIGSNLAHQSARAVPERREEFRSWLRQLEYQVYGLPREDLVVYLRVPAAEAQRLVDTKRARDYTPRQRDLLEASLAHLEAAAAAYDRLSEEPNWARIECFDAGKKALRSPEEIHREVMAAVESRILGAAAKTRT
jgi:dTMP kinase